MTAPDGWNASMPRETVPKAGWYAVRTENPDRPVRDASIPRSIVTIKPGESQEGFVIEATIPPAPATAYVTGERRMEPVTEEQMEQLWEECETMRQTTFDSAKKVATVGPVEADFRTMRIDVRPGSDDSPVNPEARGVVPVAILGSKDMDVGQIDPDTLVFGPGEAGVDTPGIQRRDVDGDGFGDLLVHFDIAASGVECFDTVVFVRDQTVGGEVLQGFDTITTPGCGSGGSRGR